MWERNVGEECGRGMWERNVGEKCGRGKPVFLHLLFFLLFVFAGIRVVKSAHMHAPRPHSAS